MEDPNGHIGFQNFGLAIEEVWGGKDKTPLAVVYAEAKPVDSMSAQMVVREAYEQTFGFFDHENQGANRPLALVAMHPKENVGAYGPIVRMFYKFDQYEIYRNWGYTIDQFLKLPHEYVELIFEISGKRVYREKQMMEDAKRKADELTRQAERRGE